MLVPAVLKWIKSHVMHALTGVDARVQALDSLLPYLQANAALRHPVTPFLLRRVLCEQNLLFGHFFAFSASNMHRVLSAVIERQDLWHRD